MRKFIRELFSNRFGIVLAALNLCYLMSHDHQPTRHLLDMPVFCANIPAGALGFLSLKGIESLFNVELSLTVSANLASVFFVFFITLQWLFIAWIAKMLAARILRKSG